MKSNIKLFVGILIGVIIAGVVGVSATILYQASDIGFTPSNPNWHVNNLESALDELYAAKNEQSVSGATYYSTDEQIVGTWVDGKTIYQKTISFSGSGTNIDIAVLNDIDTIVDLAGYVVESGVVYNVNNYNCRLRFDESTSKIRWEGRVAWDSLTGYATIQYTKTDTSANNN